MMTKVTISLPDTAKAFIQQKIEKDGYGTVSEYIRELIRRDQRAENARSNRKVRLERDEGHSGDNITGSVYDPFPEPRSGKRNRYFD